MEFGAENLDLMVEQPEVMAEPILEPALEAQGREPKQTQQPAKSLVNDMYDYMVKTNVVDAKKFPTVEKFALDLAGDDAILPEIYSYLQTDAKVKGLPDYKTFSGIVGAELAEYKKKVPTQPVSGGGGQTSSTVGQMPATEGEYQVPTTIAGIQQSLNRPVKAKEQYYVPPAKTTADLVGIDKVIAQINPNADFTPVKGNKEEYAQAKAELLDEWNRKKRTGQLDTGKSGSKAATPDKFLADNLDARASEKALKRQRAYNITEGVVNMSVKDGIDTIKAELTRQEGQAGLERRAREGEAKFATDKELKATGMYLQSLGKVIEGIEKQYPNVAKDAERLIGEYAVGNAQGDTKRALATVMGQPSGLVPDYIKQYITISQKYQEAADRNKKAYTETGIDKQVAKDIVAAKVSANRMVSDPIGAFGQLVADKVLVPMVEGIGNLPNVASKMMSLNEGGEKAKAVDGVAEKFADMAANANSLLESEGNKALGKYSMFDENSPISRGQIAFDNLAGVLGFMTSIGLSGAGASAAGAGKVGQAATTVANSFLQVHNDYYQSGLEAGLTEAQAGKYAIGNALVTSALELVAPDARFLGNAAKGIAKVPKPLAMKSAQEFAKVLANGGSVSQAVKAGSKILVKEVLPEYGQEGLQLLADKGVNAITNEVIDNDLLDTSVTAEEAGTTFVMTTAATGLMASLGLRGRVANQLELDAIGNVITGDYNQNALQLKDALDNLKVDGEKQKQIFGRLNTIRDSYNSFNQLGLPEENTIKAAMADAELRGLKKRMADMPEALQPKVQERIGQLSAYINEQLKQPAPQVVETVQAEKQAEPAQNVTETVQTEQVQPQNAAPTQEVVTEQVTAEPVATPEQTAAPMPAPAPVPPAPAQPVTPKPTTPQPVQGQPLTPKLPEQPTAKEYGDLQDVVVSADKKVVTAQVPEVDSRVIVGAETQIKNPDNTALRGRYVLVPIPAAKPSHLSSQGFAQNPLYPTDAEGRSFNERNYQDPNSQQKVLDTIAKELDPDRLITNSKESNTGMPVLDANMAVISGNGRTMALQALTNDSSPEAQQKLAEYQDAIVSEAANYGFSKEAIASMGGQPFMLARVVAEPGYQWGRVESALMNRSTTQATTSASIAQRVTTEANAKPEVVGQLNRLVQNEPNTKSAINNNGIGMLNALVSGGILTNEEVSAYQNENGVTPEGKTLLENILLGQVLDAQEVKYLYDNMSDAGGVRESILNVLPQLLATKSQKEWSLIEPLREVMTTWRSGLDEYNATTQPSIDKPAASQLSSLLGLVFKRGSNQAREILGAYVEAAQNANASVGMLGNMPTPAEVLANILKPYETKGTGKKLVEFVLNPKNREQGVKPAETKPAVKPAKPETKAPTKAEKPAKTETKAAKKAKEQATEMVASVEPAVASENVATETVEAKPAKPAAPKKTVETVSEPELQTVDKNFDNIYEVRMAEPSTPLFDKPTKVQIVTPTVGGLLTKERVVKPLRDNLYTYKDGDSIAIVVERNGVFVDFSKTNDESELDRFTKEFVYSVLYKNEGYINKQIAEGIASIDPEYGGYLLEKNKQARQRQDEKFAAEKAKKAKEENDRIVFLEDLFLADQDLTASQIIELAGINNLKLNIGYISAIRGVSSHNMTRQYVGPTSEKKKEVMRKLKAAIEKKRAEQQAQPEQPQTPQEQTIDAPIQSLEPNKSKEVEQPEPVKVKKQPVSKGVTEETKQQTAPEKPQVVAKPQQQISISGKEGMPEWYKVKGKKGVVKVVPVEQRDGSVTFRIYFPSSEWSDVYSDKELLGLSITGAPTQTANGIKLEFAASETVTDYFDALDLLFNEHGFEEGEPELPKQPFDLVEETFGEADVYLTLPKRNTWQAMGDPATGKLVAMERDASVALPRQYWPILFKLYNVPPAEQKEINKQGSVISWAKEYPDLIDRLRSAGYKVAVVERGRIPDFDPGNKLLTTKTALVGQQMTYEEQQMQNANFSKSKSSQNKIPAPALMDVGAPEQSTTKPKQVKQSKGKKQAQRVEATSPAQPVITATYQADGNDALNLTVTVDSSQPAELATTVTIPDGAFEDLRTVDGVLATIYGGQWTRQGNNFVAQVKQGQLQDFLDEVDSLYEVKATTKNATANVVAANRAQAQQNIDNDSKVWQSSATTQKGKNVQGLIAQLSMAFPNLTVVADPASVKAAQNALDIQSAGFVKDGVVYIDPDNISDEATVEEFAHIWLDIAKQTNPTLHERMLNLAADSPYMDAVNNDPTYQYYTPYKKRVEAAAKAIADAGVAYNNKFTITRLLSSFWDGIKAALSKYGIRHPMQNTNFGKVKLVDVAKLAAKDLFRAADGQLYAKNLNWARKWILDGEYWLPVSNMTSQTAYRVNFTGDVGTQSALSASNINNTANRWYLFLSTYFGTRRRILGDALALISVKDTARKNRVQRIVSAFQQDLITAIEAETEHRLKAMKANNPNVSKSDIIDQVELDFHNAFTGLSPQNIQSADGQKFLVSGKAQFEEVQRELIEFERSNGRALTTTKELESMLRDQFLAKRRLDSDEALINEQLEDDLENYSDPDTEDLEQLRNERDATRRNMKRLMAKFNFGMAKVLIDAKANTPLSDIANMIQRAYAGLDKAREGSGKIKLRSEATIIENEAGEQAAESFAANLADLDSLFADAKAALETAEEAYANRMETLTLPEQQAMDLLNMIKDEIQQTIAEAGGIGDSPTATAAKFIRQTAATKRKIAKLRSLMAVPMSMKFKKGPNGTNISFMFGDGTVQNVGELDEITIRKLQGLGQPAWQYIVNGGNSGVYMIPRPDLMMNNYMLEKLSDSLGQYVTRFYNKHDRTTDWAKMARQRIGDVAWGQAVNYIRKQLTNSKPKSIVYNKDTQQYYVINEAGVESVVPNLNAFIDQMVKHNMPDVDIVGVRSLMGPKTSRYDFSYDGRLRMLADKGSMGLMFVPTQSQIDDVISDIVSQDSVAQTKTAGSGNFNEGIFKYRKDIPEPIRLLMGEVTTASVSLPNTLEYILTAVGRIHTEQALYDTGVISDEKTPYHTYQVRFYSPPNKAGNVMAADEKIGFRREVWTTPEVASLLFNEFDKGLGNNLVRYLANFSSAIKSFNTVYAVGSQARNFISSTIFSKILGGRYGFGTDASAIADAAKISEFMVKDFKGFENVARGGSALQQIVQFAGSKFSKLSNAQVEELFNELETEGVISSSLDVQLLRNLHEISRNAGRLNESKVQGFFKQIKAKAGRTQEIAERIYGLGDDMNKIAAYLYEKRRLQKLQTKLGLTDQQVIEQAAAIVRATIPNYDEAARVFKLISKTPILASFPLYPAEVFRTGFNTLQLGFREINQGYQLKEKSLATQGMKRIAGVISVMSMQVIAYEVIKLMLSLADDKEMLDDSELEKMRSLMPDYAKNNVFVAWKDVKTGEIFYIDLSYVLPFAQLSQAQIAATKPGGGYFDAMYEIIKPFVSMDIGASLLIQIFNNEDAFGNKIYQEQTQFFNTTSSPTGQAIDRGIKRVADYVRFMSERGGLPKVIKESMGIANAALGNAKRNGEVYNIFTELSSVFLGMKANTYPVDKRVKSVARYTYDRYQEAAQVMTSALNDKRLPKSELIARRELAEKNMTDYFNQLLEVARAAQEYNVPEDELFGTRRKGKFKNNGLFAEAQIPATMREKVYDALNDPDYKFVPEFSKENERRYQEELETRE